jgi:hypothetical protein
LLLFTVSKVKLPVFAVSGKYKEFKYVKPFTFNVLDPYTTKLCVQIVLNAYKSDVTVIGLFIPRIVETVKEGILAVSMDEPDPEGPAGPGGPAKHWSSPGKDTARIPFTRLISDLSPGVIPDDILMSIKMINSHDYPVELILVTVAYRMMSVV